MKWDFKNSGSRGYKVKGKMEERRQGGGHSFKHSSAAREKTAKEKDRAGMGV